MVTKQALSPIAQIAAARRYLNNVTINRSQLIEIVLAAIVSKNHVFMLGPPGTGKTMVATEVARMSGLQDFTILIGKETTATDMFGAISIPDLKQGVSRRNVDGFLPTAGIAVLDEIWKGNSSVLNSLLTVLNERRYDNGAEKIQVPLSTALLASNELPEDDSLLALYDRCLWRVVVDYVTTEKDFMSIVEYEPEEIERPSIDIAAIQDQFQRDLKTFDASILRSDYYRFVTGVRSLGIPFSDRRARQARIGLIAMAWIKGETSLDASAWTDLVDMAWHEPEDVERIMEWLNENDFLDNTLDDLKRLEAAVSQLEEASKIQTTFSTTAIMERKKLEEAIRSFQYSNPKYVEQTGDLLSRISDVLKASVSARLGNLT